MLRDEYDIKPKDEKSEQDKQQVNLSNEKKSESEEKSKDTSSVKSGKDEVTSTAVSSVGTAEKKKITAPSPTAIPNNTANQQPSRNLWVSGLSALTRATDLKLIFGKHGKVVGAKIVTNTRSANQRCFGYVTMANPKDATECIEHLHRTELHGRMISVERAKNDLAGASKAVTTATKPTETAVKPSNGTTSTTGEKKKESTDANKPDTIPPTSKDSKESDRKEKSVSKTKDTIDTKDDESSTSSPPKPPRKRISPPRSSKSKEKSRERQRDAAKDVKVRKRSNENLRVERKSRSREILSLSRLREEREIRRRRERERDMREKQMREEERRRREIRRRQIEEDARLAKEREKLELEKLKIAKEKAELVRIQRERQKLEMEKIEFERLELKRQQRKIEEEKRAIKRPLSNDRYDDDRDRKRPASDRRGFEAPPPPRFDLSRSSGYDRDRSTTDIKKRLDDYPKRDDGYSSKSRDDYKRDSYKSSGSSRDDYKRDVEVSSRSYNSSSSNRIDSSLNSSKDRYSDRTSTSDYRSSGSRADDSRNDSSKSRYYDSQSDTRYNRPPVVPSTTTWTGNTSHQSQFGGMGSTDLWNAAKAQTADNSASWSRNNMDDNREYRFPNNDRKTSQHYPIDQSMRTTQYVSNGNSNIIPTTSTRFTGNPRW
ncbi:hypothetical protein ACKWTF_008290 [Chironomus riparius]